MKKKQRAKSKLEKPAVKQPAGGVKIKSGVKAGSKTFYDWPW
jgi:hypothetical protein